MRDEYDLPEPSEDKLPDKPAPEPLPDDVDEDAGEEDVPEGEFLDPEAAAADETVDDAEAEPPLAGPSWDEQT